MSIIFKKLMDIAGEPLQDNCMEGEPLQQRKIYTLKKTIFSSAGFLMAAAAVISFVIITSFALFFLKKTLDSAANHAVTIEKPRAVNLHNAVLPATGQMVTVVKTEAAAVPGNVPVPETGIMPAAGSNDSSIKAECNSNTNFSRGFIPPDFFSKQKKNQFMHKAKAVIHKEKPALMAKKISPVKRKSPPIVMKKLKNKSGVKKIRADEKIESLAFDLDEAFREKNNKKTDKLLTELIRIIARKDNKADYYLKLMAFKQIRNKRYDAAKRFLSKVLAKDKNDFEAGINMAVIEIRQQKYSAAKKRLIRLKELYPLHNEIDTLLNQL